MPRDNSVNVIKAIGIVAIVWGHFNSPLSPFLYAWHIPLFFFISGFFVDPAEATPLFLKKQAQRLLLPYLVFGFVGFAVTYAKNMLLSRPQLEIGQNLVGLFYWMDVTHLPHYGFVLWFLPALFVGRTLFFFLLKARLNLWLILLIFVALGVGVLQWDRLMPFALDKGILSGLWIWAGYFYFNRVKTQHQNGQFWPRFLLIIGVILLLLLRVPSTDFATLYFELLPYNLFYSLLVILLLMKVSENENRLFQSRAQQLWGEGTLFVLIIHPYVNNIIDVAVEQVLPGQWALKFICALLVLHGLLLLKKKKA